MEGKFPKNQWDRLVNKLNHLKCMAEEMREDRKIEGET
jgi:hypothetical protein